ncbi:unnamed protein product [Dicrocoelium dendriticum]|nr:unnamed protein product [Dicrocoelium dendriticum]
MYSTTSDAYHKSLDGHMVPKEAVGFQLVMHNLISSLFASLLVTLPHVQALHQFCTFPHMTLKSIAEQEGGPTVSTAQFNSGGSGLTVSSHVSSQLGRLSTRIWAKLAMIRFLACVTPSMYRKVAAIPEYFTTECTFASSVRRSGRASVVGVLMRVRSAYLQCRIQLG